MKQTFKNLLTLQDHIDFEKFYAIDFFSFGAIRFQGYYSHFLLNKFIYLGMTATIDSTGYIIIEGKINDIEIKITLT